MGSYTNVLFYILNFFFFIPCRYTSPNGKSIYTKYQKILRRRKITQFNNLYYKSLTVYVPDYEPQVKINKFI